MNEPKTPNLGLNKIDRSSPSTTYFDLDKYLDQNWEKIDEGVGQVEEKAEETAAQVSSIQERLDTEKRRSVTLEPGLQIINAERASVFKLEGLKGRTLVNLLGRDGNFGVANNWSEFAGTKAVANNIITVTGNGSDINPQVSNNEFISSFTPKVGDKLFLRVRATSVIGTVQQLQLYLYSANLSRVTAKIISNPLNGTTYDMFGSITVTQAIVDGWDSSLGLKLAATYATVAASNRSQVQYSQAAVYKISEADLSLTDDQVAAKYPYVDSVQPVRNPYAIRYGENLLPPFYEWDQIGTDAVITAPYQLNVNTSNSGGSYTIVRVPCLPNTTYRVKADLITGPPVVIAVESLDEAGNNISTKYFADGPLTTEANALSLRISIYRVDAGGLIVKNPTLTIGNESKSFKPREDSMLALQTDLYADSMTGEYAEEVFEKGGQYFKLKKWNKLDLATENVSSYVAYSLSSYKSITLKAKNITDLLNVNCFLTKYDGKQLKLDTMSDPFSDSDIFNIWNQDIYLSVSNTDSGWGESYTPTVAEIKAYFMGWKMYDVTVSSSGQGVYNGSGVVNKRWAYRLDGASESYTGGVPILPTTQAPNYTPYQLVYQLATPTVEPITSEGQLTLIEGNNQVEVGTRLVVREAVKTARSTIGTIDYYHFNNNWPTVNVPFKYRVEKILNIYANGKRVNRVVLKNEEAAYGKQDAHIEGKDFIKDAAYTATYMMLDKSPIASFVGSIAENEKALLADLNDIVQQSASSLSVTERSISEALQALIQQQNKRNVWGEIL